MNYRAVQVVRIDVDHFELHLNEGKVGWVRKDRGTGWWGTSVLNRPTVTYPFEDMALFAARRAVVTPPAQRPAVRPARETYPGGPRGYGQRTLAADGTIRVIPTPMGGQKRK